MLWMLGHMAARARPVTCQHGVVLSPVLQSHGSSPTRVPPSFWLLPPAPSPSCNGWPWLTFYFSSAPGTPLSHQTPRSASLVPESSCHWRDFECIPRGLRPAHKGGQRGTPLLLSWSLHLGLAEAATLLKSERGP